MTPYISKEFAYVERYEHGKDYTLSRFSLQQKPFGFGVEDEYRNKKVMHETRISDGIYALELCPPCTLR